MGAIVNFFKEIYYKFIHLSWVEWTIAYCKAKPIMAGIVGGLLLFIIVVLSIISHRRRKVKKAKKAAKKAAKAALQAKQRAEAEALAAEASPVEEAPVEEAAPIEEVEEVAAAETPASIDEVEVIEEVAEIEEVEETPVEVVEEVAEVEEIEEAPAPIEEVVETPVEEPAPIEEVATEEIEAEEVEEVTEVTAEEPVVEAPVVVEEATVEEAPVQEPERKEIINEEEGMEKELLTDVEETLAMADEVDEVEVDDPLRDHYDEDETDRIARYKGKWVICRVLTDEEGAEEMYFFELRASNGEKLLASEEYTSYQGALRGIQTHKTNILKGNLKITVSKKGDYIFKLLSGKSLLLCMGENYPTRARCESAVDSTIRFAATAVIDENVQDLVIKVPKEDENEHEPLHENGNGKWIISSGLSADGAKIFYFELYANNGEKLLCSEDYTTYIGAVNGIQTHKKNIEKDNFRISLTKRGDYIYKLLNGNGQLLCLGEHYRTKRLCQNAVESVKRFAMNSPLLTEGKE